jgi:hypothetical protein
LTKFNDGLSQRNEISSIGTNNKLHWIFLHFIITNYILEWI